MQRCGRRVVRTIVGLAVVLCHCLCSRAQTGAIVGRITDTSGALVKGASVTLTDIGTNESRIGLTNSDGGYRFVSLIPGRYRIDVKASGFKIYSRDPIEVRVDSVVRVDANLALGSVSESIEVKEQTTSLDTQDSSVGQVIEGRQVQETPLNGRNVMNLIALTPGVIPQGGTQGSTAGNYAKSGDATSASGFGNYQIGGGLAGQNTLSFDGAPLNEVMSNVTVLVPTQDAVQEFRVATSVPGPEIGALAGGAISFTSKSGSNAFHGSLYEYLRNTDLDANNFFNNASRVPRSQLVQNQFGATVGGPLVKDSTFFFFNYERFTRRNGIPFEGRVPTPAELSGDFRADPAIYDPLTGKQFVCNGVVNEICPNRIDTTANVMGNILHYWPVPNTSLAGGDVNYSANAAAGVDTDQYNVRVDDILSDKQRLFGRYTYWRIDTSPTQYIFGNAAGGPTSLGRTQVVDHQVVLGDIYSFSPSLVSEIRISYLHAATPITPANNSVDVPQFGQFWSVISNSLTHQQFPSPYIVNTIPSPYTGLNVTNNDSGNSCSLGASITKVTGQHTLKIGADVRRYEFREGQTVFAAGFFLFAGIFTGGALSPAGSGATPIADFVLGDITPDPGVSGFQTAATSSATQWYQGYYLNDAFQASSRLTINAGLRWEIPGSYREEDDRNTVLLPALKNPLVLVASQQYPSRNDLGSHYRLVAPRLGFAYRLHDRTVFRAGYGINFPAQGAGEVGPWYSPINTATTSTPFGGTLSNPLLGRPLLQPIGRNQSALNTLLGQNIQSRIPYQPFPYLQQWNMNVQQGLGNEVLFEIGYLGSRGDHISLGVPTLFGNVGADLNQLSPQYYSLGSALLQPTASGQLSGQTLRPYPAYQEVSADSDFAGDSYYHSLQGTMELRFSSGWTVLANYSWSKLITNAEGVNTFLESGAVGAIQDYTNLRAERSLANFDVPQRFVLSYILDLPVGRGRRYLPNATGIVDKLASGWQFAGITTFASGFPLALSSAAPNALSTLFGAGTIRPNALDGCDKSVVRSTVSSAIAGTSVLNAACFSAPGPFALGDEPRMDPTLRAQGIKNWDVSIAKIMPVKDRVKITLDAEFFSLFNRVQFGPPNTSFGSALFGVVTSQVNNPRQIQFSLRTSF